MVRPWLECVLPIQGSMLQKLELSPCIDEPSGFPWIGTHLVRLGQSLICLQEVLYKDSLTVFCCYLTAYEEDPQEDKRHAGYLLSAS